MDLNVYTKDLSIELIPRIKKRFKDFNMDVELHPNFKFDQKKDIGFLPIKLNVDLGHSKHYDKIDFEILTGFEIFFSNYDYEEELNENKEYETLSEKKSLFSKIFGKNKVLLSENFFIADEEFDKLLKLCNKNVFLSCKSHNKSELRVSLLFAAFLAELTNGIVFDPQNGKYLNGIQALETFPSQIEEYENSFSEEEFTVNKFEDWSK